MIHYSNPFTICTSSFAPGIREHMEKSLTQKLSPPQPKPAKPASILLEAEKIVNGERRSDYGPSESFGKMAQVYNELWGGNLTGKDFVRMLMIVKLVRESFKHKRDNLTDLAGYTELLNRLEDENV